MIDTSNLVVIIVLNINKKEDTLECLERVFALSDCSYEVIVVDNGSTDGSVEAIAAAFPKVHLVKSPKNLGVSGGRNLGIRYADKFNHKYLLFLDNDTLVKKDSLNKMMKAIEKDPRIGIISPKSYKSGDAKIIACAGGMKVNLYTGSIWNVGLGEMDKGQYDQPKFITSCAGFAFLVRREVIQHVGPFDEIFNPYGWEDVDFSLRSTKLGFKIFYEPQALVYHKGGKFGRGTPLPEYERYKARNFFILMKCHANPLQWVSLILWFPLKAVFFIANELLRGHFKAVWAQVKGSLMFLKGKFLRE